MTDFERDYHDLLKAAAEAARVARLRLEAEARRIRERLEANR